LRIFPGSYKLAQLTGRQFYTLSSPTTTLTGFGQHKPLSVSAPLTETGREAVEAAANKWLDGCVAQGAATEPTCPFGLIGSDRSGWLDSTWLLQTAPTYSVNPWTDTCDTTNTVGACWSVISTPFTVSFTGDKADGTYTTDPSTARIYGWVRGFSSTGAVFNAEPATT
jgi:hypothetical protein